MSNRDYYDHYNRLNPAGEFENEYLNRVNEFEAQFKQLLPSNKTAPVLDIGSGYGYWLRYLYSQGFRKMECVDKSKKLSEVISRNLQGKLTKAHHMDAVKFLKNSKSKYGLVSMIDLIEHLSIPDANKLTKLVHQNLISGGILIIRTPNMANVLGVYSRYIDITHQTAFTEFSLTQLLENAGFKEIKISKSLWPIGSKRWVNSVISRRLHSLLFRLDDRVNPSTFEKNILISAIK